MEAPKHIFTKVVTFLSVNNIFHCVTGKWNAKKKNTFILKFMDGMTKRKLFNVSVHEVSLLSVSLR